MAYEDAFEKFFGLPEDFAAESYRKNSYRTKEAAIAGFKKYLNPYRYGPHPAIIVFQYPTGPRWKSRWGWCMPSSDEGHTLQRDGIIVYGQVPAQHWEQIQL